MNFPKFSNSYEPPTHTINFKDNKLEHYLDYNNFILYTPDNIRRIELKYLGEPPHGNAYFKVKIDGHDLPGMAWGGNFAMSACSRYIGMGWMEKLYQRKSIIVDIANKKYTILPKYIDNMKIEWPIILDQNSQNKNKYDMSADNEIWLSF